MPQVWSSQGNDDPEDSDDWQVWRNARVARKSEAVAVARNLWNQATENGEDLYAGNPSDLTALGIAALSGPRTYRPTAVNGDNGSPWGDIETTGESGQNGAYLRTFGSGSQRGLSLPRNRVPGASFPLSGDATVPMLSELDVVGRPTTPTPHQGFFSSLNHNPLARVASGVGGYLIGLPFGAMRGGWHALEGVSHGLNFARGLLVSQDARAKAWHDAQTATHETLQYGRAVLANPSRLADDALSGAKAANRSLNPFATPIPDTASGTFGHEFRIGANGGETLTNIAGLFAAPEFAGGINAARTFAATREANVAKMMAQGVDEATARYLSKPYKGQGDHALIQKSKKSVLGFSTPWLEKAPIPKWFMDSPLNVSTPRGLSQGDFYEYHYGVDPNFYGGKLPRRLNGGKGWSGQRLGLERYGAPGRTWARIPPIWKDYYTGVASGEALGAFPEDTSETPQ